MNSNTGYEVALSADNDIPDEEWYIRFGFILHDAARIRRSFIDDKLKPLGLTRTQAWLLAFVSRSDGQSQSDLADDMKLGKVAMGGLIDRLEKMELVVRRPSVSDRRINNICLTSKGKKLNARCREVVGKASEDLMQDISVDEVKTVVDVMQKMKKNIAKSLNNT